MSWAEAEDPGQVGRKSRGRGDSGSTTMKAESGPSLGREGGSLGGRAVTSGDRPRAM